MIVSLTSGPPARADYEVLHDFAGSDGISPQGSLIQIGSTLYGMTNTAPLNPLSHPVNAANPWGTVFEINTDGSGFSVLHSFLGGTDGAAPYGSLLQSGSNLYGMTSTKGGSGSGTIFQIGADGTGYNILYSFGSGTFGPRGSLIQSGTTFYGLNPGDDPINGVNNSAGSVFEIQSDGSGYYVLHAFGTQGGNAANGYFPFGSLVQSGSTLYGMTSSSSLDAGTIFKVNTDGTGFTTLFSFDNNSGTSPRGSLILSGSTLYGMTHTGGIDGSGTIFSIGTDGSDFTVLHNFDPNPSGGGAGGSLIMDGSTLYGMTPGDGISYYGTVFQMGIDGSNFETLHSFGDFPGDGQTPFGDLIKSGNTLYGMTAYGGSSNGLLAGGGTVFSLTVPEPSTVALSIIGALFLGGYAWQKKRQSS